MNAELKPRRRWKRSKADYLTIIADQAARVKIAESERNEADARCFQHKLDAEEARQVARAVKRDAARFASYYAAAAFVFGFLLAWAAT